MTMKKIFVLLFCLGVLAPLSSQAVESTLNKVDEAENFIIVVGQYPEQTKAEELLGNMKEDYKDAGVFYDEKEKKYYVYVETYYSKSGADYAVWWMKKNRPALPKVWAKTIEVQ